MARKRWHGKTGPKRRATELLRSGELQTCGTAVLEICSAGDLQFRRSVNPRDVKDTNRQRTP